MKVMVQQHSSTHVAWKLSIIEIWLKSLKGSYDFVEKWSMDNRHFTDFSAAGCAPTCWCRTVGSGHRRASYVSGTETGSNFEAAEGMALLCSSVVILSISCVVFSI